MFCQDRPQAGLSRGEFARRSGLSPKALRLYERSGLLVPHSTNARTGYRTYRAGQVERARRIRSLRQMDMPLSLVARVADEDGPRALAEVEHWWQGQEEALRSRRGALAELRLAWNLGREERGAEPDWLVHAERVGAVKVAAVHAHTDQQHLVATFHGLARAGSSRRARSRRGTPGSSTTGW